MSTTPELLARMQALQANLRNEVGSIVQSTASVLEEFNRDQLTHGLTSSGNKITPQYRSAPYALKKFQGNSLAGFKTPDLKLTGAFYRGIFFRVSGWNYKFDSTDEKAADLKADYKDIMGITEINKSKYVFRTLSPKINSYITRVTGLPMR